MRKNSRKIIYSAVGALLILIISIVIIIASHKNNKTNDFKGIEEEQIDKEKLEIDFNDLFNNEENEYVST